MIADSVDNYLKTLFKLGGSDSFISTKAVAESLQISSPSVTGMFKKLSQQKLIKYHRYSGAALTKGGEKRALRLIRRHRLLEMFFCKCLDMDWNEVHREAEVMEHVMSPKLEERIDKWLNSPEYDPHGAPIPSAKGILPTRELVAFTDLEINKLVTVAEISSQNPDLLNYLKERNIIPGKKIGIISKEKFGGSYQILIDGKTSSIGSKAASYIHVERLK